MCSVETYNLCLSFTRSGYKNRVPWLLVFYRNGSPIGIRLRVKAIDEAAKSSSSVSDQPKYAFLARENAYVDNHSCWGRVVLRANMTKSLADSLQKKIENQGLSEIVEFRDCQKWVIECLDALDFTEDFITLWNGLKAKNIWDIEDAVREYDGLEFLRGPAYKTMEDVMAVEGSA